MSDPERPVRAGDFTRRPAGRPHWSWSSKTCTGRATRSRPRRVRASATRRHSRAADCARWPELLDRRPIGAAAGATTSRSHLSRSTTRYRTARASSRRGASDELGRRDRARAEGNPFFAGEIVSAVVERVKSFKDSTQVQSALARLPDTVQATASLGSTSFPRTNARSSVSAGFRSHLPPAGCRRLSARSP